MSYSLQFKTPLSESYISQVSSEILVHINIIYFTIETFWHPEKCHLTEDGLKNSMFLQCNEWDPFAKFTSKSRSVVKI